MIFVTRISLKGLDEETRREVVEALEYCREHDKYGNFIYEVVGRTVYIRSSTRDQSLKRGGYFHRKFGLYYSVIIEEGE